MLNAQVKCVSVVRFSDKGDSFVYFIAYPILTLNWQRILFFIFFFCSPFLHHPKSRFFFPSVIIIVLLYGLFISLHFCNTSIWSHPPENFNYLRITDYRANHTTLLRYLVWTLKMAKNNNNEFGFRHSRLIHYLPNNNVCETYFVCVHDR